MLGISALAPLTTCRANQVDNVFTSFHRSDQSFLILGAAFCLQPDPVTNCNNIRSSISKHHNTTLVVPDISTKYDLMDADYTGTEEASCGFPGLPAHASLTPPGQVRRLVQVAFNSFGTHSQLRSVG